VTTVIKNLPKNSIFAQVFYKWPKC